MFCEILDRSTLGPQASYDPIRQMMCISLLSQAVFQQLLIDIFNRLSQLIEVSQ